MTDNVIKFKKRGYKKKTAHQEAEEDFEMMVSSVRKDGVKAFVALVWQGDQIFIHHCYKSPIDSNTVIGALEAYKTQTFIDLLYD